MIVNCRIWDVRRLAKVSGHPPFPARERRNLYRESLIWLIDN
jgi:hypothetical protein